MVPATVLQLENDARARSGHMEASIASAVICMVVSAFDRNSAASSR
jgi:hypothetical protein